MLLLDEPFSGLDRPSAEGLEALIARAGRGGAGGRDRHPRPRAGARLRPRPLHQQAPGRLRRARRRCSPTSACWKRPTAAPSSRCPASRRPGDPAAAPSPPLMLEPLQEPFMQRALAEVVLLGAAGGALGCWVVFYGLSYAAESLAHSIFPGLVLAAIAGVPLLLGAAPAIVVAALAIALGGADRRGRPRGRGRGRGDDDVRPRRAAGALAALAARDRVAALRRCLRRDRRRPARRRRPRRRGRRRAPPPPRSAPGRRLRPRHARARSASRRPSPTPPCWSCSRLASSSPCRGSATCSSSPSSSARPRPRGGSATACCR